MGSRYLHAVSLFFCEDRYVAMVGEAMAEFSLLLFEKHPTLVVDLQKELLEVVNNRSAVMHGREEFFIHIVWLLGE